MSSQAGLPDGLAEVLERLRRFADDEDDPEGSALYARLCRGLADDAATASIMLAAPAEQRKPMLLLGAVHQLLLAGVEHRLAAFYPSVAGDAPASGDPYPAFADFCRVHRTRIERLLTTRSTQTNEPRRLTALLPAWDEIRRGGASPLALVEIGTSAGLLLLADRYRYRYGELVVGDPTSPVELDCRPAGAPPPVTEIPPIEWRAGLDLNPLDVRDDETAAWLRALVWPEHADRGVILSAALAVARDNPPPLVRGDAIDDLPPLLATAPAGASLVVFHFMLMTFVPTERHPDLAPVLAEAARRLRRPIWLVSAEWGHVLSAMGLPAGAEVERDRSQGVVGIVVTRFDPASAPIGAVVGYAHAHGRWLEWRGAGALDGPAHGSR